MRPHKEILLVTVSESRSSNPEKTRLTEKLARKPRDFSPNGGIA
jgi:hypothetical protein